MRQEDYAVEFAIVAKKIYGSGCFEKVKESFSGLPFECFYYTTVIEDNIQLLLSRCTDLVLSYDAEQKYYADLVKFSKIVLLLLDFGLRLAIISDLYWYS